MSAGFAIRLYEIETGWCWEPIGAAYETWDPRSDHGPHPTFAAALSEALHHHPGAVVRRREPKPGCRHMNRRPITGVGFYGRATHECVACGEWLKEA